MNRLIYNFKTHSFKNTYQFNSNTYSLTIGFLELVFNYDTDQLLGVQGFLPLINAERCNIQIPKATNDVFKLTNIKKVNIGESCIYNYHSIVGGNKDDLKKLKIKFDSLKGIIELDITLTDNQEYYININSNLMCSLDKNGTLIKLFIKPDEFITSDI